MSWMAVDVVDRGGICSDVDPVVILRQIDVVSGIAIAVLEGGNVVHASRYTPGESGMALAHWDLDSAVFQTDAPNSQISPCGSTLVRLGAVPMPAARKRIRGKGGVGGEPKPKREAKKKRPGRFTKTLAKAIAKASCKRKDTPESLAEAEALAKDKLAEANAATRCSGAAAPAPEAATAEAEAPEATAATAEAPAETPKEDASAEAHTEMPKEEAPAETGAATTGRIHVRKKQAQRIVKKPAKRPAAAGEEEAEQEVEPEAEQEAEAPPAKAAAKRQKKHQRPRAEPGDTDHPEWIQHVLRCMPKDAPVN
jgi:hypothetical protein